MADGSEWAEGRPGEPPVYAGTDFIIARDGRIAAVYLFLTSYPDLDTAVRGMIRFYAPPAKKSPGCS